MLLRLVREEYTMLLLMYCALLLLTNAIDSDLRVLIEHFSTLRLGMQWCQTVRAMLQLLPPPGATLIRCHQQPHQQPSATTISSSTPMSSSVHYRCERNGMSELIKFIDFLNKHTSYEQALPTSFLC
jgi:hypothetical protein